MPRVTVNLLRNFKWESSSTNKPVFTERSYDLDDLTAVWFGIDPFGGIFPLAHTFPCFEFNTTEYLSVSIEARLGNDQSYSPLAGLFGQYQMMYVLADVRDIIGQRTIARDNEIYLYPIDAPLTTIRRVLVDMLRRADTLTKNPSTYNTLTNNCTTEILKHVNKFTETRMAYGLPILLPGLIHHFLHRHNLIQGDESLAEKKDRYLIEQIPPEALYSDEFRLPFHRNR